jgi:hypothetical protein
MILLERRACFVKKRNTFYSFGVATEKDVVMIRSGASLQL